MKTNSEARSVRVAAVQVAPVLLDRDATIDRMAIWVSRAKERGAELVAFPETFLPGYPTWLDYSPAAALWDHAGAKAVFARLMENSVEVPGPAAERLARLARENQVTLMVGVHERAGRTLYNSLLWFGPDGALINHHRKLVPTYTERLLWGQGDATGLRTATVNGVSYGGLVCWEHWMPLARQVLHDAGEEIHVAAWPGVKDMHQVASRHYAFEGRCFVIAVGSLVRVRDLPAELPPLPELAGEPDRLLIPGGSAIIGPDGAYLAGPVFGEETLVVADCDLRAIARESLTLDVSGHYSRPDVFQLAVERRRR